MTPSNTPHGSNMTAIFPVVIFIIQAAVLYLRFRRRPRVVPGQVALASGQWAIRSGARAAVASVPAAAGGAADEAAPAGGAGPDAAAESGESAESADSGGSAGSGD